MSKQLKITSENAKSIWQQCLEVVTASSITISTDLKQQAVAPNIEVVNRGLHPCGRFFMEDCGLGAEWSKLKGPANSLSEGPVPCIVRCRFILIYSTPKASR